MGAKTDDDLLHYVQTCERRCEWCDTAKFTILASQFNDPWVCSDTEEVLGNGRQVYRKVGLRWRSQLFNELVLKMDQDIEFCNRIKKRVKKLLIDCQNYNLQMMVIFRKAYHFRYLIKIGSKAVVRCRLAPSKYLTCQLLGQMVMLCNNLVICHGIALWQIKILWIICAGVIKSDYYLLRMQQLAKYVRI